MELNKKFIEWFNKNKNAEEYNKIFNLYFNNLSKCRICNNPIYYYDSTFRIDKSGILQLHKKSCLTSKNVNKEYTLSICEECLIKKYPEYNNKNKPKVFNQMNYLTEYAFNIPNDISLIWMKEKYAITEENLTKKHGKKIGKEKWINYCNKQSKTNTFEYKKEKYGWDKEKFDDYNRSRSVTLENLIKRNGTEEGLNIWKNYCDRQKYTTSLNYFIEKNGLEKGTEIYENFCKKRLFGAGYSEVSKKLFDELKERFVNNNYTVYYAENEWYFCEKDKGYYLLDFFIKELNIGIEFNGDIWHANPLKYKPHDKPILFQKDITAEFIWQKDKIKNDFLKTKLDKLLIIWESDFYKDGIDRTIDKILKEINDK
jgi:hypothetical protein